MFSIQNVVNNLSVIAYYTGLSNFSHLKCLYFSLG
uniref:Uncharacterized protein n=1 Tax=Lepeophtheirus salmonis TaxID=72036 RepID=A0A0K2T326_LEPSM